MSRTQRIAGDVYRFRSRFRSPAGRRPASAGRTIIFVCSLIAAAAGRLHGQEGDPSALLIAPVTEPQSTPAPELLPSTQVEEGLTLPELESWALVHNPSLVRASARVGAARGNWMQVGLPPNPTVGFEGQQLGSGGLAEQHGIMFNQEIVRGGKLRLNRAIAAQDVARLEQEFTGQRQRVLTDVRIAFYQVLTAQRQIALTEELAGIARKGSDAADALFRAKQGGRADVLQARIEIENAEILAQNARNRHAAAWNALSAVIGQTGLPPQQLVGDLSAAAQDYDFATLVERLQTSSPEVAAAVANIQRARWAVERARVEPRPNVSVLGMVNVVDNGIGGRPDGTVAVSIPLPVFNRNQGAISQTRNELTAAQQALAQLDLDLQQRLAPVYERYSNARSQVERYHTTILPAALESLELTRQAYAGGESSFVGLLTLQRTYSQTNLNYLESLRELRTSEPT